MTVHVCAGYTCGGYMTLHVCTGYMTVHVCKEATCEEAT